jgi:hypothetical protein
LSTDVPHETQQGCIEALHAEIAKTRGLLETVRPVSEEAFAAAAGQTRHARSDHDSGNERP